MVFVVCKIATDEHGVDADVGVDVGVVEVEVVIVVVVDDDESMMGMTTMMPR